MSKLGHGLPEDMAWEDRVDLQVEETVGVPGGPQEPVLDMGGGSFACAQQGLPKSKGTHGMIMVFPSLCQGLWAPQLTDTPTSPPWSKEPLGAGIGADIPYLWLCPCGCCLCTHILALPDLCLLQ